MSKNNEENIPHLIYTHTIKVVLRGENYPFKGHTQYKIDQVYYSMALMKMDLDKILALNKYYSEVDSNGKYINFPPVKY